MSESGIQSPLGINVVSSLILNEGLSINPVAQKLLGTSKYNTDYTPGSIVNDTCLKWITYALNAAFNNGPSTQTQSPLGVSSISASTEYVIYKLGNTNWNSIGYVGTPVEGGLFTASASGTGTGQVFLNGETTGVSVFSYDNMLALGQSRIPALANGLPPTYLVNDPSNIWQGQATSGYAIPGDGKLPPTDPSVNPLYAGQGQNATWFPYNTSNPNVSVTQWGFLRCLALQAWNVFNWQGSSPGNEEPEYKNYTTQWITITGFIEQSNAALMTLRNSVNFLDGVYSNMNDLISADITGVSLSTQAFGQDLINLGKAIDLQQIAVFGKPSALLTNLQNQNALTQPVILALKVAGLSQDEINEITSGLVTANQRQELSIYSAFLIIKSVDLEPILKILQCKTKKLNTLADLLDVKKMFPISYTSLTVPINNTSPGPTNSKTYYLLYVDRELNPQLLLPKIKEIVGTIIPPEEPPYVEPLPIVPIIETAKEIIAPITPTIEAPPAQIIDLIPTPLPLPDIPAPNPVPQPYVPAPEPSPPAVVPPEPVIPKVNLNIGGGGTNFSVSGGGCVALESFVPLIETDKKHNGREITKAWMLETGMKISLGTDSLKIVDGQVIKTLNDYQPCVRISTSDGITLVCSTTAPILSKDSGFIPATEVYGKRVAVMRNGRTWFDEVVGLEDVGMKFVRVVDAGNNSFWAGERPGAFILHHNVPINDKYDYDKK